MKTIPSIICLLILGFFLPGSLKSQTYTLNWNTSFSPSWANGATTGNATNIGGSGINANVTMNVTNGSWQPSVYSSTPTPTKNGDYKTGPYSPPNNIMIALDYTSGNGRTDVTITFTPGVFNLSFYIGDIDRFFKNRNDFMDEVKVDGNGGVLLPSFTRYQTDPAFPNQLEFGANTARVGSDPNLSGNCGPAGYSSNFDVMEQAGDVYVQFGNTILNSLRIRYGSAPGVMSDPSLQAIAISNMQFTKTPVLPIAFPIMNRRTASGDDGITLIRNPFDNQIQVKFQSAEQEKISVRLFDSQGALLYFAEEQVRSGSNNLMLPVAATMPKGIYMLEIITASRKKLVARPVKL